MNMDYTQKTREELIAICKERKTKGYSNKKKDEIIILLQPKPIISQNTVLTPAVVTQIPIIPDVKVNTKQQTTKHLKPLIKWSGGKGDEIKQFEKYIPANYDTYIEPFIGGGALFFNLSPKKAVISDVHTELVDLYNSIGQGNANEIYKFMEQTPNDDATYYKVRDEMVINNSLDNAKRFYYQRKTCFRGMLRYNKNGKFNIPFGRYKTINYSELQNKDYETLLARTSVLRKSFEYVFENYNDENNFMFLDPPYDSEFTDYGYCQFGKKEQETLAKCFKETKIKCLMVIGKTKFIEELYKDYIVDEYDKKYRFKLYDGRVGDEINTKHLVIKNY
jgi:DNA adenine methylase